MLWTGKIARGTPHPMTVGGRSDVWIDIQSVGDRTLNAGNVSQADDKSGNGNAGTQSTASKQPAVSVINSKDVLSFDGIDDELDFSYIYGSQATLFMVVEDAPPGIVNDYLMGGDGVSSSPAFLSGFNNGGRAAFEYFNSTGSGMRIIFAQTASAGLHILTLTQNDGIELRAFFDGAEIAGSPFNPGTANISGIEFMTLGNTGSIPFPNFYTGRMSFFSIFGRILTTQSLNRMHRYLANQFTITI